MTLNLYFSWIFIYFDEMKKLIPNDEKWGTPKWNWLTCWPNFKIWKYTLSAFCSYFYSFQKPSGGSEKSYIVKNVPKRINPEATPPSGYILARYMMTTYDVFHPTVLKAMALHSYWDTSCISCPHRMKFSRFVLHFRF